MSTVATARKNVKTQAGFSLTDVLASATVVKKDAKSKSKVPVLTVSDGIKAQAARIREIKEQLDSLETEYETVSAEVIQAVSPLREALCKQQGYLSSVRVPDSKGLSIGISWADKYCKISPENEDAIREIAGERFDDYFTTELVVTVKDISEESLTEIIKAVGPERFAQFFAVEKSLKPTSRFTQEQFTALSDEERKQFLQSGVKPFKPSIKVK